MTARLPSLNGLRAFEAAARHLSFTQAASELNVTQTAISHQIKRLEEELGVRLFIRQNRSLTLTAEAQDYLPGIRAAFNDLRLATDRLLRKDDDHVLTVSTLASLAAKWLLPRLTNFQEAHPGIDVRITTSTSLVDFQRDKVDAAIRYGRGQWQGVRADWLMADELFPVCSPALLKGSKPLKCPEDLKEHVLLHTSNANSDDWRLWLTAAGLPADFSKQPGVTFDMIFMTVQAAIDGLGVAMGRTAYVTSPKDVWSFPSRSPSRSMPASIWSRPRAAPIRRSCRRFGNGYSGPCRTIPELANIRITRGIRHRRMRPYRMRAHETGDAATASG
jgi:LysR family transcriptional regulator, glycine cleavage system transcriptional activator